LAGRAPTCTSNGYRQTVEKTVTYEFPFTGQTTIGSGMQWDLLMMGIKMPETC